MLYGNSFFIMHNFGEKYNGFQKYFEQNISQLSMIIDQEIPGFCAAAY